MIIEQEQQKEKAEKSKTEKKSVIGVLFVVMVFFLHIGSPCVRAEENEQGPFDLGELVVTATKVAKKVGDVTSAVNVVDEAEIEASNAEYVMDIIGSLPSIYIRRDAIFGRQAIEIRGLGSNCRRILTLIDGRPEKMSLFGCTITQTLPLSNVERIEVIRGPESVLYGTDAMGGVVNIITKRLLETGYYSSALFSYGSYETLHGLLRHGGNTGKFDYYITYDRKQTDGHRNNSAYDANFFSLRTGYQLDDAWRFELSGQYFKDNGEDPGPDTDPYTNNDKKEYIRYSWDANLIGKLDRAEFTLTVYNNEGKHEFDMPSINDFWHSKDRTLGVLTKYAYNIYEKDDMQDRITAGYEYQYQWAEPQEDWVSWAQANMPARLMDFGSYERNNQDIFTFNEFTKNRWVNSLGLRAHYDDEGSGWEAIPQVGLLCHVTEETTARAKISKGFRQPRFSELHLFPAHNEDLEPEEVWSYEAALSQAFSPWFSIFINPFYMDVKNMIQQEPNDSPPPRFLNENSGEFYIRGVETGLDIRPLKNLNMIVYYTFTDIEDSESKNPHTNREGKPEHVINAVTKYTLGKLAVSLDMEYVAGLYDSDLLAGGEIQKVDNFFVMDVKASYELYKNLQIFAGIENVLDRDYEQIPGYPMPGTTVHAGLKAEL